MKARWLAAVVIEPAVWLEMGSTRTGAEMETNRSTSHRSASPWCRPGHAASSRRDDSGYAVIKPDFPECSDDFGFLWLENEYVMTSPAKWSLAANAADALVNRK